MSETTATATKTTRTRKAPAAKPETPDVVNHDTGETTDEVKVTYVATATGRGGKTNVRKVPAPVSYAVDVADDEAKTAAGKAGLIFRFFTTEEAAQKFAEKKIADGYDAIVVPATSKEA